MASERIQKVMAQQGVCSRRAAEQLIEQGRVKVNGHPVSLGDKMDPARDVLSVDGQRVYVPPPHGKVLLRAEQAPWIYHDHQ